MALDKSKMDAFWKTKLKRWLKNQKARLERRAAKRNPETQPTYGKYKGWWS